MCVRQRFVLLQADSLARTNVCAGTALDAEIGVDGVSRALGDSLLGAFADAGSASGAKIFTNFVSHNTFLVVD